MRSPANSAEHILVADDDEPTRLAISGVLREAGYPVTLAKDGVEALRALHRRHFDLAFLDIWMPGHTGLQVLERVRSSKHQDLKAVIMTVDETPQSVLQAIKDQALEYLTKPLLPEQVLSAARMALSNDATQPIELISARPTWVELLIPCTREAAERIYSFLSKLDADLSPELRHSIGIALKELLLNAVEWGGQLDATRKVRIAHIRCERMLLYRIADPGAGFSFKNLAHASAAPALQVPKKSRPSRSNANAKACARAVLELRSLARSLMKWFTTRRRTKWSSSNISTPNKNSSGGRIRGQRAPARRNNFYGWADLPPHPTAPRLRNHERRMKRVWRGIACCAGCPLTETHARRCTLDGGQPSPKERAAVKTSDPASITAVTLHYLRPPSACAAG